MHLPLWVLPLWVAVNQALQLQLCAKSLVGEAQAHLKYKVPVEDDFIHW